MPGVVGVFTAESLGLEPVPSTYNPIVARTLLASDKVRYVGEPVVAVVAETAAQATDAAEMVFVDVDFLPTLVDIEEAAASETLIFEAAGSNVVFDTTALGMPENTAADELLRRLRGRRHRPIPQPASRPVPARSAWLGRHLGRRTPLPVAVDTARAGHQGRRSPPPTASSGDRVRVITPDVGGAFGAKIGTYGEELMLGPISKALGRPVRWRETRSESMMGLGHGRAQLQYVTIGGTREGKVTHYQLHLLQDAGAFADIGGVLAFAMTRPMASAVYDIANIEVRATTVDHQHHTDGAVPRRRTTRGDRCRRAGDGHVRRARSARTRPRSAG